MDNKHILVQSCGREDFDLAFQLAFPNKAKATHYAIHPDHGFVLLWGFDKLYVPQTKDMEATPLPYPMQYQAAADIAYGWLEANEPKEKRYDMDGDLLKGFKIENDSNYSVSRYCILTLNPIWAQYHK